MSTENENLNKKVEELDTQNVNSDIETKEKEEKEEILEYPYDELVLGLQEYVKNLGQVTWVTDNDVVDGEKSKTISIARVLSNGKKQLLEIRIDQKNELIFK